MSPKRTDDITKQTVRDAVSRFLSESSTATLHSYVRREIKKSLQAVVRIILDAGWDAYLVGGTIRDIVLGPRIVGPNAYYPRDFDIILVGVTHSEAKKKFEHLYARDTRFGGLHLIDRKCEGWRVLFDVWTLEDSWGFQAQSLPPVISLFPQTPFLNLDTPIIEVQGQRGRPREFFENGFIDGINQHRIEINFEPNPYPEICLVRALIMASKLQFSIGPKLMDFVLCQSKTTSLNELMTAQLSHYGTERCPAELLASWIQTLQRLADAGHREGSISVSPEFQLGLWNNYPPIDSNVSQEETEPSTLERILAQ